MPPLPIMRPAAADGTKILRWYIWSIVDEFGDVEDGEFVSNIVLNVRDINEKIMRVMCEVWCVGNGGE